MESTFKTMSARQQQEHSELIGFFEEFKATSDSQVK
jgi:hypothetical protein